MLDLIKKVFCLFNIFFKAEILSIWLFKFCIVRFILFCILIIFSEESLPFKEWQISSITIIHSLIIFGSKLLALEIKSIGLLLIILKSIVLMIFFLQDIPDVWEIIIPAWELVLITSFFNFSTSLEGTLPLYNFESTQIV